MCACQLACCVCCVWQDRVKKKSVLVSVCMPAGMLCVTRQGRRLCQSMCVCQLACCVCDKTGMSPMSVNVCVCQLACCGLQDRDVACVSQCVCVSAGMLCVTRQGCHLCQSVCVCVSWQVVCVVCDKAGTSTVSVRVYVPAGILCVLCVTRQECCLCQSMCVYQLACCVCCVWHDRDTACVGQCACASRPESVSSTACRSTGCCFRALFASVTELFSSAARSAVGTTWKKKQI